MDCCTPRTDNHGTTGFPTEDEHRKTGQRITAAARCNGPYSSRSTDDMKSPLSEIFWDILSCCCPRPPKKASDQISIRCLGQQRRADCLAYRTPPTTTGVYSTSQYEYSPPLGGFTKRRRRIRGRLFHVGGSKAKVQQGQPGIKILR